MNWNSLIRTTHRWLSLGFTLLAILVTVLALTQEQPAEWIFYTPLLPLALLLLTGLYLFVLPYVARWRGGRRSS